MSRLVQGDVDSSKILVALMLIPITTGNGYQVCMVAPTEILTEQHFTTTKKFLGGMDVRMGSFTGMVKGKERSEALHESLTGEVHILVGTCAVIEGGVRFPYLGMAIVDE